MTQADSSTPVPKQDDQVLWTGDLKKLEENLQDAINQHISKSSDRIRQAFRIFTAASHISPELFYKQVCKLLNAKVPAELCQTLFRKFDTDGSGDIDLGEFVNGLFPKDYTEESWNVKRENEERDARDDRKSKGFDRKQFYGDWTGGSKELETRLQDIIQQHTSKSSDRVRQAYKLFTATSCITSKVFREQVCKLLSAKVPPEQCDELFKKFDTDGSGDIDLQEFVVGLMPKDYTQKSWNVKREYEEDLARVRNRVVSEGDFQGVWTGGLEDLKRRLQDTISQHTSKSSDQCRQAFKMFTAAQGITPEVFIKQISKIMCAKVPEELAMQLFNLFDTDGSGDIDLMEFMNGLMPKDYTENLWNVEREDLTQIALKSKKKVGAEMMNQFRTANELTSTWSMEELELRLQDKIMQRTSKSSDQFRQAFKLFTIAGGITPDMFHQQVNKLLGVNIAKDMTVKLFKRYDTDGSGDIDLSEFVNGIMPNDWEYVSIPIRKFPRLKELTVCEEKPPQRESEPVSSPSPSLSMKVRKISDARTTTPMDLSKNPASHMAKLPMKPNESSFRRTKPNTQAIRKISQVPQEEPAPSPNQILDAAHAELWKVEKLDESRIANLTNLSRYSSFSIRVSHFSF